MLLAVQHYYIRNGKDVEPEIMKQLIQEIMPAPMNLPQNGDGKVNNKKVKPFMNEKQIDDAVQEAIRKDADVSGRPLARRRE